MKTVGKCKVCGRHKYVGNNGLCKKCNKSGGYNDN